MNRLSESAGESKEALVRKDGRGGGGFLQGKEHKGNSSTFIGNRLQTRSQISTKLNPIPKEEQKEASLLY